MLSCTGCITPIRILKKTRIRLLSLPTYSLWCGARVGIIVISQNRIEVEERYTKNLPEWRAFSRFANSDFSTFLWVVLYALFFWFFASSLWLFLLLPVVIAMGGFHGAIINWFAHKYGYINFKLKNTSMNLLFIDILMLGESYHNNHHKHPSSVNFGRRWHEIDPVYPIIRLFARLGIISIVKPAMVHSINSDSDGKTSRITSSSSM